MTSGTVETPESDIDSKQKLLKNAKHNTEIVLVFYDDCCY